MADNESLAERFNRFIQNDWAHAQQQLGEIKGRVDVMLWALGITLTLTGAILVKLLAG